MTRYSIPQKRCKLVADGAPFKSPVLTASCFEDAAAFFRAYYDREALPHERMVALLVNGRDEIMALVKVSEGGLHGGAVLPADVLRPAIIAGASGILLAHNHPSGDATPSTGDIRMTLCIVAACDAVGLALLDHFVVGAGKCTSLREIGVML